MSKQDRQGARTPADLERRYGLTAMRKSFAEVLGVSKGTSASTNRVLTELVGLKKTVQKELSRINNTIDSLPARDELDASRLADINTALEENGGTAADTLDDVDEKIPEVHAAGVQSEYDRFWDAHQQNGNRSEYLGGFCGAGWNKKTFNPKYAIKPKEGSAGTAFMFMFFNCRATGSDMLDYANYKHLFDWSNLTNAVSMFEDAGFDNIDIDMSNVTTLTNTFRCSYFVIGQTTITIKVSDKATSFSHTFDYQKHLKNLTFVEGSVIAATISFAWSPLSKASIESVFAALSTTTSGLSITFSKEAVDKAFETSAGAADGSTSEAWTTLIGTRPNWTISLV